MLDSAIRLSIITATFNTDEFLPRLIDSLKSQSDPDFEWIVADGGSTDETLVICTMPPRPCLWRLILVLILEFVTLSITSLSRSLMQCHYKKI